MRSRMIDWQAAILLVLLPALTPGPLAAAGQKVQSQTRAATSSQRPGSLASQIQRIAAGAGRMRVGIRVVTLEPEPKLVYEQQADEQFKPASNQKIITSAAVMCLLPADFKYRTVLARHGEDLVIIGDGDPSTGDPRMARAAGEPITAIFHRWAEALKAKGTTKVTGDLLYDDYIFEQDHLHAHWKKRFNLQAWYAAPVGGLNFNDNCVDVLVRPGPKPGEPAEVTLVPGTTCIRLENKSKTAAKGEPVVQRSGSDPRTVLVSGSVSRGNSDPQAAPSLAIPDPGEFFASACRTALAARGIEIHGETRRQRFRTASGGLPAELRPVAVYERELSDVLWRVNKSSMNLFAEALLKTMGAYVGRTKEPRMGSYETGRAVVQQFLTRLGFSDDAYVYDDGSGLSHDNRATPAMFTTILVYMDRHPRREEWWDNLAVPGEKIGTLRNRMRSLAGKVFAKTGSIDGVSALSGYVIGPGGRRYAFSILCNDTHRAKTSPHGIQDEICRTLAAWTGPLTSRDE